MKENRSFGIKKTSNLWRSRTNQKPYTGQKHRLLLTCAPIYELPSNLISTREKKSVRIIKIILASLKTIKLSSNYPGERRACGENLPWWDISLASLTPSSAFGTPSPKSICSLNVGKGSLLYADTALDSRKPLNADFLGLLRSSWER